MIHPFSKNELFTSPLRSTVVDRTINTIYEIDVCQYNRWNIIFIQPNPKKGKFVKV